MNVSRRELIYTVSMLILIAFVVFVLNLFILGSVWNITEFRGASKIKAISISQTGKPHYLTSVQKKELLDLLNQGDFIEVKETAKPHATNFQKISLHLFEDHSIDIMPLGTVNGKTVFVVKEGNLENMLVEKESGQIQKAINLAIEE